jgi:hypothetical protein
LSDSVSQSAEFCRGLRPFERSACTWCESWWVFVRRIPDNFLMSSLNYIWQMWPPLLWSHPSSP